MNGTDEGRLTCGDPFCNPGDSWFPSQRGLWQVPSRCSGNPQAAGLTQFLLCFRQCLPKRSCATFSNLKFWTLSWFSKLWVLGSSCVVTRKPLCSQHIWKGFWICLLRWSSTTGFAHPALDNAHKSFLEVFGHNVNYNWSNECDCEFSLKKCYIEKKIHAEISWCSSKNAEDRTQNQSWFKIIWGNVSEF